MGQRPKVANREVIEMEQENVVAAKLRAAFIVGKRPYADKRHAPDFVFAGARYHHRVPFNRSYRVVMRVVVADGDDVGLLTRVAQAKALVVGVSNYGRVLALKPEARVAKPDYFCHCSLSFTQGRRTKRKTQ